MPPLQPDAPCPCCDGRRYGACHQLIAEAPKGAMIAAAHREYATAWSETAEAYAEQGVYDLLAEQLFARAGIGKILDLGCGLGHGVSALRRHLAPVDGQIIALDENPECLAAAAVRQVTPQKTAN